MTDVVAWVRKYGEAAVDDEFNGITYWTDDQIEEIADRWSTPASVKLVPIQVSGRTKFKVDLKNHHLMENEFLIYTENELAVATPVGTWEAQRGILTFGSDLSDTVTYYVTAQFTNGYEAVADLWEQKANQRFDYIDWKAQNNKMNMKQEYDHCVARASYYRNKIIRRFPRQRGRWSL